MPSNSSALSDKVSLMLGIKRLAELAAALPWSFPDHAAPRLEIQALREHHSLRRMASQLTTE